MVAVAVDGKAGAADREKPGGCCPEEMAEVAEVGAAELAAAEGSVMAMAAAGRGGKEDQGSTAKPGQAEMAVEAAAGEEVAVA